MLSKERLTLWLAGLLVLAGYAVVTWREALPQYERYQDEFRQLVKERFGPEKAEAAPRGLQQIWLPEANQVDRCTTCHLGVNWKGLQDVEQPLATHPPKILEMHPVEEFGCTLCHGGQGYADALPDAHGWVSHWGDPLLDSKLSADYKIADATAFVQIKCNACHRYDRRTEGADLINRGKELIQEKGCRACHIINGRGGSIGPDLTQVGDKDPEQYEYSRLTSIATFFSWQVAHLQNPKSLSPDTIMPDFGLSTRDAQSIGLVLMSWRDREIPLRLLPGVVLRDVPTPEEAERERIMLEGEGKFFVEKTCFVCHDVSSLGIVSATKIGPDLALAVEDAPRRFGRTLDDFFMNPSGTMQVVLSRQIQLTNEEKREAVRLMKVAYEKHRQQNPEASR